ncbi:MAG: ComF family protein [Clostridiales bacterium]|nr:ComF family protein [Clostridiales bacterium]
MRLLSYLFPPRCILCTQVLKEENSYFCPECRNTAPFVKTQQLKTGVPFLSGNTSVFYYEDKVKRSIRRLKYYKKPQYAVAFGMLLANELEKEMEEPFDVITWVPAYRFKTFRRGYNQAELIAKQVAKLMSIPARGLLTRTRPTRPQNGLTKSQRKANVLGAFCCCVPEEVIHKKRVLLVDDILTTGSTASECARMLFESKCQEVYLATVAKTREK